MFSWLKSAFGSGLPASAGATFVSEPFFQPALNLQADHPDELWPPSLLGDLVREVHPELSENSYAVWSYPSRLST